MANEPMNTSWKQHDAARTARRDGRSSVRTSAGHHRGGRRRGSATVEFAIVATLFFMMVFGMIEFGRMIMVHQVLTAAAREGAREASLEDATSEAVTSAVQASLVGTVPDPTAVSITIDPVAIETPPQTEAERRVTVSVTVPFGAVTWLPTPWFIDNETPLTAAAVMRRE